MHRARSTRQYLPRNKVTYTPTPSAIPRPVLQHDLEAELERDILDVVEVAFEAIAQQSLHNLAHSCESSPIRAKIRTVIPLNLPLLAKYYVLAPVLLNPCTIRPGPQPTRRYARANPIRRTRRPSANPPAD